MDPNANLALIRRLLPAALEGDTDAAEEIAALVESLDSWISGGGVPPAAWCRS